MTLKTHTKFEKKLIRCFKNDKNLTQALESLKKLHLIGSHCAKCLMFDLKKYRGVIFHDTEDSCKI